MERIVGIDLGTTNSLIAYIDGETPRVIPDANTGSHLLPSVVSVLPDGSSVIGQAAIAREAKHPLATIRSVKRFMGLGIEHVSQEDQRRYAFADQQEEKQGIVRFALRERNYTPPEIVGGGCSGLSYKMNLDAQRDGDRVFEREDVKVLVDRKSFLYLRGTELDYSESLMDSGFKLNNPNVKRSCGCGSSFSV